jgi:hypothetical protein
MRHAWSSSRPLLRVLTLFLVTLGSGALLSSYGQEKTPSIGKITYQAAVGTMAGAARVAGSLVAAQGKALLLVLTDPPGAQVSIDGQVKGVSDKTGIYKLDVPLNKQYKIVVNADKYKPYQGNVSVSSSNSYIVSADLEATFGGLHLFNVPQDAVLFLDNEKKSYQRKQGTNEVILAELPVGEHKVKIEHPDFVEWEKLVDVIPKYELVVTPTMLPAAKVTITSIPGVEVLIDNVKQGVTDSAGNLNVPTPVEPGSHSMIFSKPGFVKLTRTENLARGNNPIKVPELEPNPSYTEFVDFFKDGMGLWEVPSVWQWGQKLEAVTVQGTAPGFVSNRSFRDFDANFNVKFTNGVGAAWVLRAKNPKNYYLFQLSVKEKLLRSFVVEDGKATLLQTSPVVVNPTAPTSYRIRAEVQGDRIRHYLKNNAIDDEEMMGTVSHGRFRYGAVGLITVAGEQFLVEDFFVKPYEPAK